MKILIIGGNRFFGKKLAANLVESGHSVTLLNRQSTDDGFGQRVARIKCDRKDATALKECLKNSKWDLVYDQVCFDAPDAKAACEIFRGLTPRYIFTSSLSVYGPGKNISESAFDPCGYKFSEAADSKTQYAEAKRQCEAVFHSQNDFEVVSLRFPFVLGPDDYTNRLTWHVRRAFSGEDIFFPNPEAKVSFINSDDAGRILGLFSIVKFSGPINLSSNQPVALKELLALVESAVGKRVALAAAAGVSNHSPYGIDADWYMDTAKLESLGVEVSDTNEWLPALVCQIAKQVAAE